MTTKLKGLQGGNARERMTAAVNAVSVWSASCESQVSVRECRVGAAIRGVAGQR